MSTDEDWANELDRVDMRAHAHAYVRKGWAVVPIWGVAVPCVCECSKGKDCPYPGKHPSWAGWRDKPITSGLGVDMWWEKNPRANIGIATGEASGIVVVDIDPRNGGVDSWGKICRKYGKPGPTPASVTGGGGRHIIFAHPSDLTIKSASGYMPGIDIKADGGMVVAPPSMHTCGERYAWHHKAHPRDLGIAPMPDWVNTYVRLNGAKRRAENGAFRKGLTMDAIPEFGSGGRNDGLCRIVGRLIFEDRPQGEIERIMHDVNECRCKPPLPAREVDHLIAHALHRWGK